MKNKKVKLAFFAVFLVCVTIGGYTAYLYSSNATSDLLMANVEALSAGEEPNQSGCTKPVVSNTCYRYQTFREPGCTYTMQVFCGVETPVIESYTPVCPEDCQYATVTHCCDICK